MVIYLEEAVERKRVAMGGLTVGGLHEAVMEGALLRLRPKIMTVFTVVAGLLPIMWSTRTGSRSDEAACHPRARRHGQLSAACADCDSRDLHPGCERENCRESRRNPQHKTDKTRWV